MTLTRVELVHQRRLVLTYFLLASCSDSSFRASSSDAWEWGMAFERSSVRALGKLPSSLGRCSMWPLSVLTAACRVPEILAIDLAVVVAVTNTAANNSSLGGRAGQVALAGNATVSVGGVGVATSQVLGADLAVVVAVKGV